MSNATTTPVVVNAVPFFVTADLSNHSVAVYNNGIAYIGTCSHVWMLVTHLHPLVTQLRNLLIGRKPGRLIFGTGSTGSTCNLFTVELNSTGDVDITTNKSYRVPSTATSALVRAIDKVLAEITTTTTIAKAA